MPKNTDETQKKRSEASRRDEFRARRQREQQQKRLIPIILISLAAVIVVAILIIPALNGTVSSRPNAVGLAMGNPDAQVVVESFADFQCPSCALYFKDTEPKIVNDFVKTNKIYYKFVPFSFIGAESIASAQAAYCASDQGKFWEYHDTLFNNQHGENTGWLSTARLISFGKDIGLNTDDLKTCLDSGKYKQRVTDDVSYGQGKGIDRTPSFLVNGRLVYADTVYTVIQSELAAKGVK